MSETVGGWVGKLGSTGLVVERRRDAMEWVLGRKRKRERGGKRNREREEGGGRQIRN